jgi:hypothetical protein
VVTLTLPHCRTTALPHRRTTALPHHRRPEKVRYWHIDFGNLVDMLWFRLDKMEETIKGAGATGDGMLACTLCAKPYQQIDIPRLLDMSTMRIICDMGNCGGDVESDKVRDTCTVGLGGVP